MINQIKQIKQQVGQDAEWIIATGIPIEKKRKKYRCPNGGMHRNNDLHPSMGWDKKGLQFKCFVCGNTIDIYDYHRKYQGLKHKEVLEKYNLTNEKKETTMNTKTNKIEPNFTMKPLNDRQLEYLHKRGLEDGTIKQFEFGNIEGNIGLPYYSNGQVTGIKVKKLGDGNKYISIPGSEFGFFNKDEVEGKELIITEGEFDAAIVHQCGYPNTVSLGTGANSTEKLFLIEADFLSRFNSIIVLGDNDLAGIHMEETFKEKLGSKVMKINKKLFMGCKDINEVYLQHGKNQVCKIIEGSALSIPGFRDLDLEPYEGLKSMEGNYIHTNIRTLDYALNDLGPKMLTLITGRSNGGKSTLVNQIMLNAIDGGNGVLLVAGEGLDNIIINNLYRGVIGGNEELCRESEINRRSFLEPKDEVLEKLKAWRKGKFSILNKNISGIKSDDELFYKIDRIMDYMKSDLVVIDNMMSIINVGSASEKFERQAEFMERCLNLAKNRNVHVVVVAHPNKTLRKGERMEFEHISGNQDIANKADNIISVQRYNMGGKTRSGVNGAIEVLKNRYFSNLPKIDVHFDEWTKTYFEIDKKSGAGITYGLRFFDEFLNK